MTQQLFNLLDWTETLILCRVTKEEAFEFMKNSSHGAWFLQPV